ncbi:MAG: Flp pilus assembly protein CpaB [Nitrospinota bacterium]|nr:Flp pilus assembly protein CpaB [Nitrospinota bacterium]MDH5678054.1 Flp pilus assembly protein CpaB [Nitrospinota bacterium]MDH5755785.1 Flp pilus assembly protein CpaB [Nitrospinota bacterium]
MKIPNLSVFSKPWVMLTLALILGGVATVMTISYLKTKEQQMEAEIKSKAGVTVQVVVPAYDLPKGARISFDNMMIREIPAEIVSSLNITGDSFSSYVGQELGYNVESGVPLLRPMLRFAGSKEFSDTIPESLRALTIRVDEINSISGMLRPGDRIDIFVKMKSQDKREGSAGDIDFVFPIMLNTPVKATGQMVEHEDKVEPGENSESMYSTATLEVTPRDAQRLILAQAEGKITAVLRNSEDYLDVNLGPMTAAQLMMPAPDPTDQTAANIPATVRFILGGFSGTGVPKTIRVLYADNSSLIPISGAGAKEPVNEPAAKQKENTGFNLQELIKEQRK